MCGDGGRTGVMSIHMNGVSFQIDEFEYCENITILYVMHESAHSFR